MTQPGRHLAPDGEPGRAGDGISTGDGSATPAWFWSVRDRTLEDELSRRARELLAQGAGAALLVAGVGRQPAS